MTPPDDAKPDLGKTIFGLAQDMVKLEPGPLARLRRMDTKGVGEGDFWVLATRHGLRADSAGLMLVRILALLTPKGQPQPDKKLHDGKRALGTALFEAKYPEKRLLRFLSLPFEARGEALENMARWLATKGREGLNTVEIAYLLFSQDVKYPRRLAQRYYDAHHKAADKKDDAA